MHADLRAIAQAANADPVAAMFERVGDMTNYNIFHNLVLVATYIKPPKIMKNAEGKDVLFHFTDKTLAEDRFQGKVGLIIKMGPLAFKERRGVEFGGAAAEVGDWVMYRPSDGTELFIKDMSGLKHEGLKNEGIPCRLLDDFNIMGRISAPSLIY